MLTPFKTSLKPQMIDNQVYNVHKLTLRLLSKLMKPFCKRIHFHTHYNLLWLMQSGLLVLFLHISILSDDFWQRLWNHCYFYTSQLDVLLILCILSFSVNCVSWRTENYTSPPICLWLQCPAWWDLWGRCPGMAQFPEHTTTKEIQDRIYFGIHQRLQTVHYIEIVLKYHSEK